MTQKITFLTVLTVVIFLLNLQANPSRPAVEIGSGERRVALIIGNGAYKESPLRNPVHDAKAMAESLRQLGFEVMQFANLSKRDMEDQIRNFGKKLKADAVGLFYFSGHGIQVNGRNFLIPVGHTIEKEQDVEYEAVEASRVLGEMEAAENRLNIVILDACRNNPFARSFRSDTRGLAIMRAPSGTVVAYSTGPGAVASDGEAENGLYTQELLNSMREPGLKLEDVFKKVRVAVKAKSKGKQIPWETSALEGDFYFSSQRSEPSGQGDFSTPQLAVETFLGAALARNLDLLSRCFAQDSEGEFAPLRNKTASPQELEGLAEFVRGAIITGVKLSANQNVATVQVKFRSRDEEIHMVRTETGWKVQGF